MKHLLSMRDLSSEELLNIVKQAVEIKKLPFKFSDALHGKILAMIFEKPSTRTRFSFEAGMLQLGGTPITVGMKEMQLGRGETIGDTAKVLSRYVDCVMARVYKHSTLEEMAATAEIPIINGLSDLAHPCQAISDLVTVYEQKKGKIDGVKMAYVGDGNNVCNSLMFACAMAGVNISVATPNGYEPKHKIIREVMEIVKKTQTTVNIVEDPNKAVESADFIYTDVWVSMGDEAEKAERMKVFKKYSVNAALLKKAKRDCKVMHCLPAHRGLEVTASVMDGPQSIVWDQAENRMHGQKAILLNLLQ